MSKHTPGPWRYYHGPDSARLNDDAETKFHMYRCAEVTAPGRRTCICDLSHTGSGAPVDSEDRANGILIAQAPRLLAALEALVSQAEAHISYPCPELNEAKATLAAAKGE